MVDEWEQLLLYNEHITMATYSPKIGNTRLNGVINEISHVLGNDVEADLWRLTYASPLEKTLNFMPTTIMIDRLFLDWEENFYG